MKNKITILIFALLFSLTLVSAITIYSGEPVEIELEKPYDYYSVVGNSTEVILNITPNGNGNNVTVIPNKYSLNDSYEIIFFDKEKETITVYQSSGGGGGGTRTVYKDKNVITYIDKEVEVLGDTIKTEVEVEVEKEVVKIPWLIAIAIIILFLIMVGLLIKLIYFKEDEIQNTVTREENKYE